MFVKSCDEMKCIYDLSHIVYIYKKNWSQRKRKEFTVLLSSGVNVGMFAVNAGDCLREQWELKEFLIWGLLAKSN